MYVQKIGKFLALLLLTAFLGGCEVMENIFTLTGTYKVNVQISEVPLDECSFISSYDEVRPYFEESVSNDLDVTGLVVFLRNSRGTIVSSKINYSLNPESLNEQAADEIIVTVNSLDSVLPVFPIPEDLEMGRYSIVFQVMRGREILQRTEKPVFYLGRTNFSYKGINVYLPGIINNQVVSRETVPRGTVVMLEADVDFDSSLDPYIIWYEDRRKISEGKFSEGAGQLFWKVPERSGFLSLRAEIFPVDNIDLKGYQKEMSVFIPLGTINVNLIPNNINEMLYWYSFDGSLRDLIMPSSAERDLKYGVNKPQWVGLSRTYGAASGYDNLLTLPKVLNSFNGNWQVLFRMFPVDDGSIFSVLFNSGATLRLSIENHQLVLSLASSGETVMQKADLPLVKLGEDENLTIIRDFFVAGVSFSVLPYSVSARLNIVGNVIDNSSVPITLRTDVINDFQIILGAIGSENSAEESEAAVYPAITAVWDEFALYYKPPVDTFTADIGLQAAEDTPAIAGVGGN